MVGAWVDGVQCASVGRGRGEGGSFSPPAVPTLPSAARSFPCNHTAVRPTADSPFLMGNLFFLVACVVAGVVPGPAPQIAAIDKELVGYREQLKRTPPSAQAGIKARAVQVCVWGDAAPAATPLRV